MNLPTNALGWLHNDGLGNLTWIPGTASNIGLGNVTNDTQAIKSHLPVNVRDYGAVGDGLTDNSNAIAAAVAALPASSGALYFPAGTYLCNPTVAGLVTLANKTYLTIYGDGMGTSIIRSNTGSLVLDIAATCSYINIHDLTLDGNCLVRTAGQQALIMRSSYSSIYQVEVVGSGEFAIYVVSATDIQVLGCLVRACFADGINFSGVTRGVIAGCQVDGVDDDLIALGSCADVTVADCTLRARTDLGTTWGRGIAVFGGTDILISDVNIDTVKQDGVFLNEESGSGRPTRVKLTGVKVRNAGINSGCGITLQHVTDVTASGCFVDNTNPFGTSVSGGHGMSIADWQGLTIMGCHLTQRINNAFARGIWINDSIATPASWDRLTIKGNVISQLGALNYQSMYLVPNAAVTLNTAIIDGNACHQVPIGDYIYYDYSGADFKIVNNTNTGSAITDGGHGLAATLANNN